MKRGGEIKRNVLPQLAPPIKRVGECEKGLQTLSNEIPFFNKRGGVVKPFEYVTM